MWSGATHSHFERSGKRIYIVHSCMANKPMTTYVSWSISYIFDMCWCSRSVVDASGPARIRPADRHVTGCDWLQSDVAGREYSNSVFCIWTIMPKLESEDLVCAKNIRRHVSFQTRHKTLKHHMPLQRRHMMLYRVGGKDHSQNFDIIVEWEELFGC